MEIYFKGFVKKIIPFNIYLRLVEMQNRRFKNMDIKKIFTTVYKKNIWGGEKGSFYSGTGSKGKFVDLYENKLIEFIKANNIRSILDLGCGDFSIMKNVTESTDVSYIGADIVDELIAYNNATFSNSKTRFIILDAINDSFPKVDMIIIRQVLQHLSNEQIQTILNKTFSIRYVVITEHLPIHEENPNADKMAGPDIRLIKNSGVFINKHPFSQKIKVLLEYDEDFILKNRLTRARMRTCLVDKD